MKVKQCPLCSFSIEELSYWAEKRYIEKIPTVELIKTTKNEKEREIVTIVGMMDVSDDTLLAIASKINEQDCAIYACRERLRSILKTKYHYLFTTDKPKCDDTELDT